MTRSRTGILALDLGTSSVRAVVYDGRGRLVPSTLADVPYQLDTAAPGQASSDPDELATLIEGAIDTALKAASREQLEIGAVATSCYWHSLVGIDRRGRPTTELFTWADTRSDDAVAALRTAHDERRYHRRTGCYLHASYWPAKLRWLQATRASAFRKAVRWLSMAEYLYGRFFDDHRVSLSMASGTGLFDVHRCRWDQQALAMARITDPALSPLTEWDQPQRGLQPRFARRWPELRAVPWFLALGDGAVSNVGAGCLSPRSLCVMIGTSSALRVVVDAHDLEVPDAAFAYRLDRRHFVLGGALSEGGNVIRWLRKTLAVENRAALESAVHALPPAGHGLTMLPFWAGERSPDWRTDARGVVAGLSLSTKPDQIVRASMEGIAFQFGEVYAALLESLPRPRQVVATGGQLLHSPTWMQILADVLALPVSASREPEASSRGAALLALHALGLRPDLWRDTPGTGRTFRPHPSAHRAYAHAQQRQAALYRQIFGATPDAGLSVGGRSSPRTLDLRSRAARR